MLEEVILLDETFGVGALHINQASFNQFIGTSGNPVRGRTVSRTTMRRVVFEATILGRVVAGGDHNSVSFVRVTTVVIGEDRMRNGRGRSESISRVLERAHAIGS